ncbi:MAG: enoyl-CoA hydratase/isomerase family protein [Paludibaculum sp.]
MVTIDNPPVNALSPGVPEGIAAAVRSAALDNDVHAIVVIGSGRTFIAGADIREFGRIVSGEAPPLNLNEILSGIEGSPKPVIMAIHGTALGGGLETAMAGHYRVAVASAKVGQPEVKLGLIPGAGGTQRLPRLAGVETAMRMCAFGEPISAAEARDCGIVDRLIEGDLLAGAVAFANEHPPVRRTRDLTAKLSGTRRGRLAAGALPGFLPQEAEGPDRSFGRGGGHRRNRPARLRRRHRPGGQVVQRLSLRLTIEGPDPRFLRRTGGRPHSRPA